MIHSARLINRPSSEAMTNLLIASRLPGNSTHSCSEITISSITPKKPWPPTLIDPVCLALEVAGSEVQRADR